MKAEDGPRKMRAIAEEAFAMVREYKGSHSGEHGDGLVRSEFHEAMFGARLVRAFENVKDTFDPDGLFNPGKIVRPPKMDDPSIMRTHDGYAALPMTTALDWSPWGGFLGATEMCNNNGECRKFDADVMCPSYRVTAEEKDVTRGRANTLRLAVTGQLGPEALASDAMRDTLDLCVSCKGCRRECPNGIDMARMKIEFRHAWAERHGLSPREKLIAYLPRYAKWASRLAPLANWAQSLPLREDLLGFSMRRPLPRWRFDWFRDVAGNGAGQEVVLFVDTFTRWFEPENARAAMRVLQRAGCRVATHNVCCGRTFLAEGRVDEARAEARKLIAAFMPHVTKGAKIVGLEPSCLYTLKDEYEAMGLGPETEAIANAAMSFEEFVAGRDLPLKPLPQPTAYLHGHCHQKSFFAMGAVAAALGRIPELAIETIASSCCGMAGSFGYEAEHYDVSVQMAEASLLPALRAAPADALIVADGTSCRAQIRDGIGREALHVARVLDLALE